jgi:hypothetical protein
MGACLLLSQNTTGGLVAPVKLMNIPFFFHFVLKQIITLQAYKQEPILLQINDTMFWRNGKDPYCI